MMKRVAFFRRTLALQEACLSNRNHGDACTDKVRTLPSRSTMCVAWRTTAHWPAAPRHWRWALPHAAPDDAAARARAAYLFAGNESRWWTVQHGRHLSLGERFLVNGDAMVGARVLPHIRLALLSGECVLRTTDGRLELLLALPRTLPLGPFCALPCLLLLPHLLLERYLAEQVLPVHLLLLALLQRFLQGIPLGMNAVAAGAHPAERLFHLLPRQGRCVRWRSLRSLNAGIVGSQAGGR
mmetsp:Transcript_27074/g.68858  ORF Transcript_27074/g.68858 Transcript_27074/m.68858 type:complete len:240 (+) Transcript_27074:192-911(+)